MLRFQCAYYDPHVRFAASIAAAAAATAVVVAVAVFAATTNVYSVTINQSYNCKESQVESEGMNENNTATTSMECCTIRSVSYTKPITSYRSSFLFFVADIEKVTLLSVCAIREYVHRVVRF